MMNYPSKEPLISPEDGGIRKTTIAKISAILLAAGVGIGVITYGTNIGFNNNPRAPHNKGIELADQKANREIMCLRELFHDTVTRPFFKNKWSSKHCDPDKMAKLSKPPNQLVKIVDERKTIFKNQGIDPATETWYDKKGKMKIEIDEDSKAMGISAGKIKE